MDFIAEARMRKFNLFLEEMKGMPEALFVTIPPILGKPSAMLLVGGGLSPALIAMMRDVLSAYELDLHNKNKDDDKKKGDPQNN